MAVGLWFESVPVTFGFQGERLARSTAFVGAHELHACMLARKVMRNCCMPKQALHLSACNSTCASSS